MESWPQQKSSKEIQKQLGDSEQILDMKLKLDSFDESPSVEEIKQKYPERYKTYLQLLRAKRNNQEIENSDLKGMTEWIEALNNLDAYVEDHKINESERILRARQFTVFEDIRTSLEQGKKEGYVKLPTGMGKTVLFSQVLNALRLKTLVVVPSKILVNQTGEKLEEFTDVEFGKYYQNIKDLSKDVTVITYSSLILAIERGELDPKEYGALILDEVHKGLGDKTVEAIDKFDCVKLGFTATPEYSEKKHVDKLLENKIHEMTIIEAVREGLISRFKSIFAFTETDLSQVPVTRSGEYDEKSLEKAINTESRNLSAVQLYKEMFSGQSSVAYCGGVAHATDLAALFNEHGVSARVISGKTPPDERKEILEKFKSGEIQVLCNAKLLIEGFDEPRATVALNLHPTLSQVDAEQRAGRVLRLDKNNPDKWGYIVDFIDKNSQKDGVTFPEIARAAEIQYKVPPEIFDRITQDRLKTELEEQDTGRKLTHPKIEGLNVVVDTQEILSISKNYIENRVEISEAPSGWLNANQVSIETGINHQQIQKLAEKYRAANTDWFENYKAKGGVVVEHYNPSLVEKIKTECILIKSVEKAPKGWMSGKALSRASESSYKTIEKELDKYRESNPEWFKTYKTPANQIIDHYSPELSQKVITEIKKDKVEVGWYNASTLRDILHVSDVTVKNFTEQFREKSPYWFKNYKNNMGKTSEYYHPDLIVLIEEKFPRDELSPPPIGWMTVSQINTQYGYDNETVKKQAEQYRSEHVEWFEKYKTKTKIAEHYHPLLVQKIKEWYEKRQAVPVAPAGWMTSYALALELKRDTLKMKALAEPYRQDHADWFKEFKAGKNMIAEHYHPLLVEKIREDFKKK